MSCLWLSNYDILLNGRPVGPDLKLDNIGLDTIPCSKIITMFVIMERGFDLRAIISTAFKLVFLSECLISPLIHRGRVLSLCAAAADRYVWPAGKRGPGLCPAARPCPVPVWGGGGG